MPLQIDHQRCTLCGRCVEECPYGALREPDGRVEVTEECTLCGACVEACPVDAIVLETEGTPPGEAAERGGVWVYGEQEDGRFHRVVFELIGKGAELAEARGAALEVAAAGHRLDALPTQLAGLPVDRLHLVEHPALSHHRDGPHSRALARLIQGHRPEIVLAGATARGRSLMPRVAVLCGAGLTADCTGLEIDPDTGRLLQTRPAFGGNIMATILTGEGRTQMATVRPRVMGEPTRAGSAKPEVHCWVPPDELVEDGLELVARTTEDEEVPDLAEADVLVAGGRGLGGPEGFEMLRRLADLLGGEVAASRAAVDAGWVPYYRQVGQTGRTVQPRLYVAVGISGALQHRAGMGSSETIVAVNTDPEAPIFEIADYGIVADFRAALPALLDELRKGGADE